MNSTVKKEIAAKQFLELNPSYTVHEVSKAIELSKGTLFNYLYNKVEEPWFKEKENYSLKKLNKYLMNRIPKRYPL